MLHFMVFYSMLNLPEDYLIINHVRSKINRLKNLCTVIIHYSSGPQVKTLLVETPCLQNTID